MGIAVATVNLINHYEAIPPIQNLLEHLVVALVITITAVQ